MDKLFGWSTSGRKLQPIVFNTPHRPHKAVMYRADDSFLEILLAFCENMCLHITIFSQKASRISHRFIDFWLENPLRYQCVPRCFQKLFIDLACRKESSALVMYIVHVEVCVWVCIDYWCNIHINLIYWSSANNLHNPQFHFLPRHTRKFVGKRNMSIDTKTYILK